MPFSWDDYPYTNFHELNLDWFIKKFKEIFDEWEELYTTLQNWKETTTQELEDWKTGVETDMSEWEDALTAALAEWKTDTEQDISDWETGVLSDLNDWKDAFETLFDTTFSNLTDIKTDAEAARDRAEAAAESAEDDAEEISESLADIAQNTSDIYDIKNSLSLFSKTYDVDFANLDLINGVIRDTGTYNSLSQYKSYIIPIEGQSEVVITANNDNQTIFAFLKNNALISDTTCPFAENESGRRTQTAGTTATYQTPENCRCLWIYATGGGNTYTPTKVTITTNIAKNDLIYKLVSEDTISRYINSSGIVKTGYDSYQIQNNNYGAITIKAGNHNCNVSFIKSSIAEYNNNDPAPICDNEPARHVILATNMDTLYIPSDCEYIVIMKIYNRNDFTPEYGYILNTENPIYNYVETKPNGISEKTITACIIGASIEAGRTHDRLTGESNPLDPDNAYLTVALRNNGIYVTNKSQGGMGWKSESNTGNYTCKGIIDNIISNEGFNSYKSLYFCLGANDFSHNAPLGSVTDVAGDDTVCGQIRYAIETVFADNPGIKIFIKYLNGGTTANSASVPYTRDDLVECMTTICDEYGVEIIKLGRIYCNGNKNITTDFYPHGIFPDGSHPCPEIMVQMAIDTTGRITFK